MATVPASPVSRLPTDSSILVATERDLAAVVQRESLAEIGARAGGGSAPLWLRAAKPARMACLTGRTADRLTAARRPRTATTER
jgi:hypothetical protein